jgi:hypothetical protein
LLAALVIGACGRTPEAPPPATPPVTPPPASSLTAAPDVVPKAAGPAVGTSKHETSPDPLRPMTKTEEAVAMPKAGQANDHSNPAAQPVQTPK